MREYLMGEREQQNDLMAWNADQTRMPCRMHPEYLRSKADEIKKLNCAKLLVDFRDVVSVGSTAIGFLVGR